MQLKDMQRTKRRGHLIAKSTMADEAGVRDYEIAISGPARLVQEVFKDSDFETHIAPNLAGAEAERRTLEFWSRHSRSVQPVPLEVYGGSLLDKDRPLSPKNTVFVCARRVRGQGTWWGFWFPSLILPPFVSVFFILPPVCNCFATTFPIAGAPDL